MSRMKKDEKLDILKRKLRDTKVFTTVFKSPTKVRTVLALSYLANQFCSKVEGSCPLSPPPPSLFSLLSLGLPFGADTSYSIQWVC